MAAAHAVVHGQHFQWFHGDAGTVGQDVGDHLHRPAVAQHFIRLGVADREHKALRHRLEPHTLPHRQFADDIVAVHQFDGVLLALYRDLAVPDFVDGPVQRPAILIILAGGGQAIRLFPHGAAPAGLTVGHGQVNALAGEDVGVAFGGGLRHPQGGTVGGDGVKPGFRPGPAAVSAQGLALAVR